MHELPSLPYKYSDLESHIDETTMRLHHTKHHQAYVDKLNAALEGNPELGQKSLAELLTDLNAVPEAIRTAVRNHGGGHWNHTFFWQILAPAQDALQPRENTITAIDSNFGNLEEFQKQFKDTALNHFGSGWAWLVQQQDGKLEIMTTPNQDTPISEGKKPILVVDVWEHAYYLQYQNRRADYLDAFLKVINWRRVEELLSS
jgi:Fe-Mn family superoxide dismutase